ncbi:MAG: type II toxin-antitoxin system HicB family antitoxin [Ruminiclostridium sp.]|nr:type II toxin-antitoxin system HicB family antitoxin [Ruminiclostridium sp.]
MLSMYPACFYKEKEGGYSVIFPVLGTATCGDTLDEAVNMAVDCLAGYLYNARLNKEIVPKAPDIGSIDVNTEYDDYESAFVNIIAVDVDEYAKKHFEKTVSRTVTIPEWLSEMAEEKGISLSGILQNALKQELHVI